MTNADPHELQKFSDLAHRWWDPNAEFKPLHELNPVRLNWIDAHAHLAGKHVLDIGCGGGILSESMAGLARTSKESTCRAKPLASPIFTALKAV